VVKFWDTSALVALAFPEPWSESATAVAKDGDLIAMWWGTPVELESAVQRAARNRRLDDEAIRRARVVLDDLREHAAEIAPGEEIREAARRIVRVHDLRAADAFQLAAGLSWCSNEPEGQELVSLDRRLRTAAEREGFVVLPVDAPG
jgi:uncharacterized protein